MRQAGLHATISADASPLEAALRRTESAAQAWGIRMAGITQRAGGGGGGGMGGGGGGGGRGGMGAGFAVLELSRGIEDAQYGLRGMMNNIPQLALAMGGGAGLAGAASLAAVAISTLGKRFMDFMNDTENLKRATAEVERLDAALKEAGKRGAKEALEGTAEAAERLKDVLADANDEMQDQNAKVNAAAELKRNSIKLIKDEVAALEAAQAVDKERNEGLIKNSQARVAAAQQMVDETAAAAKAAANVAEAMQFSEVDPFMRTNARDRADARAVEAQNALEAYNKIEREERRKQTTATNELNQAKTQNIQEIQALEMKQWEEGGAQWKKEQEAIKKRIEAENKLASAQHERLADQQAAYDKEVAALQDIGRERQKNLNALESSIKIQRLRDQGRDTQADREERKERINTRAEEIQQQTGVSPSRARRLAEDEIGPRAGRIDARSRRKREAQGIDGARFPGLDEIQSGRSMKGGGSPSQQETVKNATGEGKDVALLRSLDTEMKGLRKDLTGDASKSDPVKRTGTVA